MVEALPAEERSRVLGAHVLGAHGQCASLSRVWSFLGYEVDPEGFGVQHGKSYAGCLNAYSKSDAGQTKFRAVVQFLIDEIECGARPAAERVEP